MINIYSSQRIKHDLLWYLIGAILPMLVLLLRSPIYTRVFTPAEYGQYTLVYLVFLYLSTIKLEWIRTSIWRYYLKYKKQDLLIRFWQTVSTFFVASAILIIVFSAIWIIVSDNTLVKLLVAYGAIHLISQELITIILITKRIEGKSAFYNLINGSKTMISFLLLLVLTFVFDFGIPAFFLSIAVVNIIYLFFLLPGSKFGFLPRPALIERNDLKRFFGYGFAGTLTMASTMLLISSDRWIINWFWGMEKTGIYNQTYMLGQMSIMAISTVINASFNPYLINNIERNRKSSDRYIGNAFKWYIYIVLPLAVYISLYAHEVATVMLGPEFREIWDIIPLITFAFLLDGLCHFSSIKLKFFNRIRFLYLGVLIAAVMNLSLNFLLIPAMVYKIAAYTTFASYVFLFLFYYFSASSKYIHNRKNRRFLLIIASVLAGQVVFHFLAKPFFDHLHSLIVALVEGTVFATVYFVATFRVSPIKTQKG